MNEKMEIRTFYGFGRITVKFLPSCDKEWVMSVLKREVQENSIEISKTMTTHKYASTINFKNMDLIVNEVLTVSMELGRQLWADLQEEYGFTPTKETATRIKRKCY